MLFTGAVARARLKWCNFLTKFLPFSKLVVVISGLANVEELVSVDDAPSARFAPNE